MNERNGQRPAPSANADQAAFWNSEAGQKWVENQEVMDAVMAGVLDRLLAHATPAPGERVLDIGCGTGASTLALGRLVGPEGRVTGVDISDVLLGLARRRLADAGMDWARVELADAQTRDFAPSGADLVVSRFGVMFFDDPVAAFANMARALRPGGRLAFVAWAEIDKNPWFKVPRDAAIAQLAHLGRPEPAAPRAPGPLAFAELDYVQDILGRAGFVGIEAGEEAIDYTHQDGLDGLAPLAARIGPAARIARELGASERDMEGVGQAVLDGFRRYVTPDGIRVPARLNFVRAAVPGG